MSDSSVAAGASGTRQVTSTRHARHELPTAVLDLALDPDERRLYLACFDGVYQLDLNDGQPAKLETHDSYASGVVRDPARPVVISAGYDGQLIWYDLQRRALFRRVRAHRFWSWKLAISPDGRYVTTVGGQYLAGGEKYEPAAEQEPSVKLYDVRTGDLLHAFSHIPPVQAVAISGDSRFVAAGNVMGEIRVWDVSTGERVAQWTTDAMTSWGIIKSHCYIGGIYALHFGPSADQLYAAGMGPMRDPMAGNGRQLWQQFAWRETPVRQIDETHKGESGEGLMETLAMHPCEPLFLMGGRLRGGEWNAALFSALDGTKLHHLNTGFRMTCSAFTATGDRLIVGGADKQHPPKDGTYPPFGIVEMHTLNVVGRQRA
jgi:WD40 repeat protein